MITNSDPRVISVLNSLGVGVRSYDSTTLNHHETKEDKALLDFLMLSYDVGYEKPDIRIFNAARIAGHHSASSSGTGAWRYVHVGDDPVKDYQGAESAGWKGILVDRMTKMKREKHTLIVQGLDEILEILIDLESRHFSV